MRAAFYPIGAPEIFNALAHATEAIARNNVIGIKSTTIIRNTGENSLSAGFEAYDNMLRIRVLAGILDRFIDSSVAYQGYGGGIALDVVQAINQIATESLCPDITFWLDGKSFPRDAALDQIELRDDKYFERVRAGYQDIATADPGRVQVIDANQAPEVVHYAICERMQPWLRYLRGGRLI
jgi:hypothetical protein